MAEVPAVELLQEAGARRSPSSRTVSRMKRTSSAATSSRDGSLAVPPRISRERPRVALRAAADHDRGRARRAEHGLRPGRASVTSPDAIDRDVDALDELRRERVVGAAGVHLLRRARVERQRLRAGLDEPRADARGTRASRSRARGASSRSPARRPRSATASTIRHARSGSSSSVAPAPVFVTLRTGQPKLMSTMSAPARLDHRAPPRPSTAGSEPKICTASGRSSRGDPQVAERALVPVLEPGAADHLRADEPGAEAAALAAEGLHADARHRREHEPRRDLDRPDPPALTEIYLHNSRKS